MGNGTTVKKSRSVLGKMDAGFMILGGIASFADSRSKGHGLAYSLGKTVVDEVFYSTPVGKAAILAQFAGMGFDYAAQVGKENAKTSHRAYRSNFGGNYSSSQNGYTMRQRGLTAMNNAGVNARNALGSEARMFHRMHYYDS